MIEKRFPTIFDNKVNLDLEKRCYPDMSEIKVFRYKDNPPSYQIMAGFNGIKQLVEELGSPNHDNRIYCVRLSSAEELFKMGKLPSKRFLNYSVERFGLRIEPFPAVKGKGSVQLLIRDSSLFVSQPSYWYERSDYLVQVWRTRVFASPVNSIHTSLKKPLASTQSLRMYLEERWHPNRGKTRSLHWLEPRDSRSKVDQFKKDALRILDGVKKKGRPPGSKKLSSQDEFIFKYKEAFLKQERRGVPRRELVAEEMKISPSTLYRRLKEYELSWPPDLV